MKFNPDLLQWTREPKNYIISTDRVEVITKPNAYLLYEQGAGTVKFGIYACSPEDSSFKAVFTNMEITDCKWAAHVGQMPDDEG